MSNFNTMNLSDSLLKSITRMGYTTPTPIQAETIPIALTGKDIIGTAQTGTGKTAAFLIPLFSKLMASRESHAIILAPTRELALQIMQVVESLMPQDGRFPTALLVGGADIGKQLRQLKAKPRLVVATPGRVNDHIKRRSINLKFFNLLVLDEFDRMLDIGFTPQIEKVISFMGENRQTLMFSATLTQQVIKLSKKYLTDPAVINAGTVNTPVKNIDQKMVNTTERNKYDDLLSELSKRDGSIIIFVSTKSGADKLSLKLNNDNQNTSPFHGDIPHRKRERVVKNFKSQDFRILVATDIAARGLDINHIRHVINYDLPRCPEDYIHRLGRTARAGAKGSAVSFIVPADGKKWTAIKRIMKQA
ncbi:DEAD/DEAH box helicase [Candidatus Jidaibacter acanthamoebae]|nr:DEAD/DEAH box helicase [Candidatus Jidaibacter acanthamoeba]